MRDHRLRTVGQWVFWGLIAAVMTAQAGCAEKAAPVTQKHQTDTRPALTAPVALVSAEFKATAAMAADAQVRRCNGAVDDVMLQGFHWESDQHLGGKPWYQIICENAGEIKAAGFTCVWFPPPTETADTHGYLPTRWYKLDTLYGTTDELKAAIAALGPCKAVADIVVNHRCGVRTDGTDFEDPSFLDNNAAVTSDDECHLGTGKPDGSQYESQGAGRDLDHSNVSVQKEIKAWQQWLKKDIGFAGWRYDQVRGYDGKYVGLYNDTSSPDLSVGEFWDGDRQKVVNWIDATGGKSMAFDFPTRELLKTALAGSNFACLKAPDGKPAGVIGWWKEMSVTFIENHDTEPVRGEGKAFPSDKIMQGYAYILTHPGIPCVFWRHYFDCGDDQKTKLRRLMQVRRESGIGRDSTVWIDPDTTNKYAAVIDDKVAVKIGPGAWSPTGAGWKVAVDGQDFAVWQKTAPSP